jgi:hypothetical protein
MDDVERRAVDGRALVRVMQARADRRHDREHRVELERPADLAGARQHAAEVLAVEKLHGEEHLTLFLADRVDLHDVGVMERPGDPRLVQKHPHEVLVMRVLGQP